MTRGRRLVPWVPEVGHRQLTARLPRDVKVGWDQGAKGQLLLGWDQTSDTLQLWRTESVGAESEAVFLGFVTRSWDGRPDL